MSREEALRELLQGLFSAGDLHRFLEGYGIAGVPVGRDLLADAAPWQNVPFNQFTSEVVQGLKRRGLIDGALFERLRGERPNRAEDIAAVESLWAPPPAQAEVDPPPPLPLNPFAPFAAFVGRERELGEVQGALGSGRSTLLIGGRRAGKTSLIQQIAVPGRRAFRGDVAQWSLATEETFLSGLGALIRAPGSSRDAIEARLEALLPVVVILDEADRLLRCPWGGELLSWLRYLDDTRFQSRISLLLVGGPALWRYRNPDDQGSPPLNTSWPLFLDPLSPAARAELADKLERPVDRDTLFAEAGGHPYLLSLVLGLMWGGASLEEALEKAHLLSLQNFKTWRQQLGDEGLELLKQIPGDGLPLGSFRRGGSLFKHGEAWAILRSLCLVDLHDDRAFPAPRLFRDWLEAG